MYHAVRRIPLLARNGIRAAPLISSRSSTRGLLVSRQKGRICGAHFSSQHSSLHLARETKRNDDICAGAATHATPNVLHTSAATSASDVPFPLLSTADDVQRLLEDMFGPTVTKTTFSFFCPLPYSPVSGYFHVLHTTSMNGTTTRKRRL